MFRKRWQSTTVCLPKQTSQLLLGSKHNALSSTCFPVRRFGWLYDEAGAFLAAIEVEALEELARILTHSAIFFSHCEKSIMLGLL